MKKFQPNPIVISNDGKMLGVVELKYDAYSYEVYVEIVNIHGHILFEGILTHETFLAYDVSHHTLIASYYRAEDRMFMGKQTIDLLKHFEKELANTSVIDIAVRQQLYDNMVKIVKDEMDSPTGNPEEVDRHTKMLNETTINTSARIYVTNKIRSIINNFRELTDTEKDAYAQMIYANLYGMGVIQSLDDDPDVGEIMVNGYVHPTFRCDIYYLKKGRKYKYEKTFKNLNELTNVFSRAIAFSKKELNNMENAIVEATRSNRDRVNIIIPEASESYVMNIRKFGNFVPSLETMKAYGTVDDFIDELMEILVRGKANIGIGGPMGTGKTTFINFSLGYTEKIERKVVIASVAETDLGRTLKGHDVVILNVDDLKGFTFERLKRSALRTTADRIIVPESRGEEFRQVYEANLQTKGNMFTAHALEDYAFLDMCVDMYAGDSSNVDMENLRNKIAKSLDIVIIMRLVGEDIRIKSISEVVLDDRKNFERMNMLYYWHSDPEDATKGEYRRTENRISDALKLRLNEYGIPMSVLKDF